MREHRYGRIRGHGGVVADCDSSAGYVGVFSGALAFIAYFGLLDNVGAIRGNLVFYAVPIVATLGGWALLGEAITPTAVACLSSDSPGLILCRADK